MKISSQFTKGLISQLDAKSSFNDLYVLTPEIIGFAENFANTHSGSHFSSERTEELTPLLEKYMMDKSMKTLTERLDSNPTFSLLFTNTEDSLAFAMESVSELWNKTELSNQEVGNISAFLDKYFMDKFTHKVTEQVSANPGFDHEFIISEKVIDFVQQISISLRGQALCEKDLTTIFPSLESCFENKFIKLPKVKVIIDVFFASRNINATNQAKEIEARKFYRIVKWNLGLAEKHPKRRLHVNENFWKDARKLFLAYTSNWLLEEDGKMYIDQMLASTNTRFPEIVEKKIKQFCSERLRHFGILNDQNLEDCFATTIQRLRDNDMQNIRTIEAPGALWGNIRNIINNLYKLEWKLKFTERLFEGDNRLYAHLTLCSYSYIKKELIDDALYYSEIRPVFIENIIEYYHPKEDVFIKRDRGTWNAAIKKEISKLCDELKIPIEEDGIELHVNTTYKPALRIVPDFSQELRYIYPFMDRLEEEDYSEEDLLQSFVRKLDDDSPLHIKHESATEYEITQLLDVLFKGKDSLRKVFIKYTTQTGNKGIKGGKGNQEEEELEQKFALDCAIKLYNEGYLTVKTNHPVGSPEWKESLRNKLYKESGKAVELIARRIKMLNESRNENLDREVIRDLIAYCINKSAEEQFKK